jgi:SAM-dependent methyltransferase
MNALSRLLEHPLAHGRDLDDPQTTAVRRQIIAGKPFLVAIYQEWYALLRSAIPDPPGAILELGAGAGFIERTLPEALKTDVLPFPGVDLVADARGLPFVSGSLRAILMTNVFHHVPDAAAFLSEASRTLRPGGVVAMIEPWSTSWSRFVYRHLHHEPFDVAAPDWVLPPGGPLSGANGALPWIVLHRDRARFDSRWPEFTVDRLTPIMPLRYLLSGGVSLRALMPSWTTGPWRGVERLLEPFSDVFGMFVFAVVRKRSAPGAARPAGPGGKEPTDRARNSHPGC